MYVSQTDCETFVLRFGVIDGTLATSVNVGCNFMLGVAVEVGGTIVIVGVFEGEGETRATEVHPETNNVFNTTTQISL